MGGPEREKERELEHSGYSSARELQCADRMHSCRQRGDCVVGCKLTGKGDD